MGTKYNPRVVSDSVVCLFDIANIKNFDTATLRGQCSITGLPFTANNTSYVTIADGFATFDRAATAPTVPEKDVAGGTIKTNTLSASSFNSAKFQNFFYNDHTWEVLFRINDAAPSNYDVNETQSTIVAYKGYNAGFIFDSTNLKYDVWNGTTNFSTCANWTIATEVPVGTWNHIAVTRSGDVFSKYKDGRFISSLTQALSVNNSATGTLGDIGVGATAYIGSNFVNYGKVSVALFRMYSRALSDVEIYNNFTASRGRVGI